MIADSWERQFEAKIKNVATTADPAHDLLHFRRVVRLAKSLAQKENAELEVVVPAAWLHDLVVVPKDSPLRDQASRMSAITAKDYLKSIGYPEKFVPAILHAIEAHSFSSGLKASSLEAMIVQDADRLDAIGAVGVARCFATAGVLNREFYSEFDPFCKDRLPDDSKYTIDHFYKKLFKIAATLNTRSAQIEGQKRIQAMRVFLESISSEIGEIEI